MNDNRLSKGFAIFGIICIISSICLVVYNFLQDSASGNECYYIVQKLKEQIPEVHYSTDDIPSDVITNDIFKEFESQEDLTNDTIILDGNEYIGIVSIPLLGIELPVLNQVTKDNLKMSPCRYYGTLVNNDLIIAAHNYKSHFGNIQNLNSGDKILFIDVNGVIHTYEVIQSEIILGTDIETMIDDSSTWDLTLFTCTLSGISRVTIRAVSIDG